MFRVKTPTAVLFMAFLATSLGCSASRTHEVIGGHVDDEVITTQVQTAILSEPGLRVPELKVRTFEGVVQLSGFVSSRDDIQSAVRVALAVNGVKAVADQTQLK